MQHLKGRSSMSHILQPLTIAGQGPEWFSLAGMLTPQLPEMELAVLFPLRKKKDPNIMIPGEQGPSLSSRKSLRGQGHDWESTEYVFSKAAL